jgi:hypothetical protein
MSYKWQISDFGQLMEKKFCLCPKFNAYSERYSRKFPEAGYGNMGT